MSTRFPVIDPVATGENIARLRCKRGLTVRDLQKYFGFEEPRAIYKWQRGQTLPSVDNLFALGVILQVSLDEILVPAEPHLNKTAERQVSACRSAVFSARGLQIRLSAYPTLSRGYAHHKGSPCAPFSGGS